MQNLFVKFSIIIFVFVSSTVYGQGLYKALNKADSMYINKKYAEAYTNYLQIFEKGKYTPQMLLKMAYVKEGLGEVPEALYYLNVYYVNFPGQNILKKMESLAETKNIAGYEYNDLNYFLYLYYRYKSEIILSMVGLLFFVFLGIVTNRVLFNRIPVSSPYLFLFLTAFVYIFINYSGKLFYRGIVTNNTALIMNAPSAGSNLLTTLPKGTRIHIWGETDIWFKIRVNGMMGYVRKSNMTIPQTSDDVIRNSFFSFKGTI